MTVRAAWLQPAGQTREDTRLAPIGTYAPTGELTTRGGVLPGGQPFAPSGAGAMQLQIGPGRAVIQGTAAQGAYPVALDAPEVLSFEPGDAQFARIDTVALRVYDGLFDAEGQTIARPVVIQGAPADQPTAPALPPATIPLWDVRVPAGASAGVGGIDWGSALTDRRVFTTSVGGIIPRATLGDRGAYDGQYADIGGTLYRWSEATGAWVLYRPPAESTTQTTTGLVVGSGWALTTFQARRSARVVSATAYLRRTGAPLAADPNLNDVTIATLPAGWRPVAAIEAPASDGYGSGVARVDPDGDVVLRTWSPGTSIGTDANVRFTATFIQ